MSESNAKQEARERREALEQGSQQGGAKRRRMLQLLGVLAAAAAVVVVLIVLSSSGGKSAPAAKKIAPGSSVPGAAQVAALIDGIPQSGITLGAATAPVTLVEFADLQCPFCRDYTESALPTVIRKYVRTGKLEIQFRNLSFIGPDSITAGRWAAAAGEQNKLWQFIDLWYANQQTENSGYVTPAFLRQIAGGVSGLNVTRVASLAATPAARAQLTLADKLASQAGVNSTPSFLLGKTGSRTQHPLDYNDLGSFTAAIDSILKS